MRKNIILSLAIGTATGSFAFVGTNGGTTTNAQANLGEPRTPRERVQDEVRRRLGRSIDEKVSEGHAMLLPLSQRRIMRFKVAGDDAPRVRAGGGIDVDLETGSLIDGDALLTQELAEIRRRNGKQSASLRRAATSIGSDELVEVAITIAPEGDPTVFKPAVHGKTGMSHRQAENLRQASIGDFESRLRAHRGKLLDKLKENGIEATFSTGASTVFAKVPKRILSDIESVSAVSEIDTVSVGGENELNIVSDTLNYNPEIHQIMGIRGNGVTVGIVEVASGTIAAHTNLTGIVEYGTGSVRSHATGVAGIIKSNNTNDPGFSPQVTLRHGGSATQSTRQTIFSSHVTNSAASISLSYAAGDTTVRSPNSEDKFLDERFTVDWVLPIKSAGNRGATGCDGTDGHTTHPGLGYNTLTVGGFNDNNTVTRVGDSIYNCSSFTDPTSANSDREKPEIVAPAVSIRTTNTTNGFTAGSGTSYAAPGVNGLAALMRGGDPGIGIYPELTKAIIMATSTWNIEGNAVISDNDGVGAIDPLAAMQVLQRSSGDHWASGYMSCNSTFPFNGTAALVAGRRTRVVTVWHQDTTFVNYETLPGADLALTVRDPSNAQVADADRWDDTWEVAEFTPSVSGTYTISIGKWRCDKAPKYIAVAWYQVP